MEYTWKAYVQLRVGFRPRPLAWDMVAGSNESRLDAREKATAWIREVNSHQTDPTQYWVTVVHYRETSP